MEWNHRRRFQEGDSAQLPRCSAGKAARADVDEMLPRTTPPRPTTYPMPLLEGSNPSVEWSRRGGVGVGVAG
jgi:hypothetical protein